MIRHSENKLNLDQLQRVADAVKGESDRGLVLICSTVLDEILKRSIESHLVRHKVVEKLTESFNAPIGSFHARILLSFAIGLIPEDEYRQLDLIRKIRNEFAHSVDAKFQLPRIISYCQLLSQSPMFAAIENAAPREAFAMCAAFLIVVLESRLPEASNQRLFYQEWKAESSGSGRMSRP